MHQTQNIQTRKHFHQKKCNQPKRDIFFRAYLSWSFFGLQSLLKVNEIIKQTFDKKG